MTVKVVDSKPSICTDTDSLHDLISMLDIALNESPDDPDLLVVRASAHILLNNSDQANHDLNHALQINPKHIEAFNMLQYAGEWNHLLFLPPWSSQSNLIHPVLAENANQGEVLQSVRHSLQTALIILFTVTKHDWPDSPTRYRWEAVCNRTPFGPIGAHYILLERNGQTHRQECLILSPQIESPAPHSSPPALLTRLSSAKTCFIILADQQGEVLHNLRYDLPMTLRSTLKKISHQLLKAIGTNSSENQKAANWHMEHFDMNQLSL